MRYDAIVVGGSFAGLSAATQLARARRPVVVVDAGRPRNRFSTHAHGVIGQDGSSPSEILNRARAQVAAYPAATIVHGDVVAAETTSDRGFAARLADGTELTGRRLLLATGVRDVLPAIPGLVERWGKTVVHCPYCHGYEIGGGRIGVLATGPVSLHGAWLVADWGEVTLFTDDTLALDPAQRAMLRERGVTVEPEPVVELVGTAPALDGVRLRSGRVVSVRAMFVAAPLEMTSPLAERLGCAFDDGPLGAIVRTDPLKQTTVPGCYAAGDNARIMQSITFAVADGMLAGVGMHQSLIAPGIAT